MSTLNVILNGARGGQGTSTIASALAIYAAGHCTVQLVAIDASATAALLGVTDPGADEIPVTDRLMLTSTPSGEPDVRIVDAGSSTVTASRMGDVELHLVVLRGPCYVALRSLVRNDGRSPDGIVLLSEPGRSLTARDVHDVTGIPVVATVAVTPAVARTIDAGLLLARLHRLSDLAALRRYATMLLAPEALYGACSAVPAAPPAAVIDLNESCLASVSKIGTDLPVALCATG